ncbi:MAG TPA: ribonuclease H-like YkuK family protein [Chitinophagaceae bacterium]|nr:ribonuclease H-like YkuK family protein [Chitinophagaceae bacterium]
MEQQWKRLTGEEIHRPIAEEIESVICKEKQQGHLLKACIGTDSQVKGTVTAVATVIVLVRKGKGGFMYIRHEANRQKMSIKQRMLLEVSRSIEVAYDLYRLFALYEVEMEVHADINTNPEFRSSDALSEAMGYIMSMGFAFKAKPQAFASSSCANKAVR